MGTLTQIGDIYSGLLYQKLNDMLLFLYIVTLQYVCVAYTRWSYVYRMV